MENEKLILRIDEVSDGLLSGIESRDVALWIRGLPENPLAEDKWVAFLSLPWRLVVSEISNPKTLSALETQANNDVPMTRKRGFVQIIESDPSRIDLPQRCLPFYLLNGRSGAESSPHADLLRRLNMLEELRRSGVAQILVISGDENPLPPDLIGLWSSGFRTHLTLATDQSDAERSVASWLDGIEGVVTPTISSLPATVFVADLLERFEAGYPEDRHVVRVRDRKGELRKIDITSVDDPERPLLERYELIEDRDLEPLVEMELSEDDFVSFFRSPESSWRPYAAGLPWVREEACRVNLEECLKQLNSGGPQENRIAYILSEAGAGGTTIARTLAWEFARQGYPVMVARPMSFVPDALAVGNFLTRVHFLIKEQLGHDDKKGGEPIESSSREIEDKAKSSRYEVPWIIVFDRLHWEARDSELRRFLKELEKQGRPVCILVVTGPIRGLSFFDSSVFKQITELNHTLDEEEARKLGRHLNKFLRVYGKDRQDWQWDKFYKEHTVRLLEGTAAFWVTLSFWIQGQYDLNESIQQWMYRQLKEKIDEDVVKKAIFEIAALSSERVPMPDGLLPPAEGSWPVSHLLEDNKPDLGALGLVRLLTNGQKYWALAHDILGRFLVNALFYDYPMRERYGFSDAKNADHLRFMLLRKISQKRELGERDYSAIGEDFATSIFKVDPDHGHNGFVYFWREVLDALDEMPRSLRDTNRVFRHHTAVTRRRIAKLSESFYGVTTEDRVNLLRRAIDDLNYALVSIDYTPGSESNLNLYNSLANAYLDLAEAESVSGAARERVLELRQLANDATRKAYDESPDNSFTIETYVKNILVKAQEYPEFAMEHCIEALSVLFSAISSNEANYRRTHLAELADKALRVLFKQIPAGQEEKEPRNATDVLLNAWIVLAEGVDLDRGVALTEIPSSNREKALVALAHPVGIGNTQVIRLNYDLICISRPTEFAKQLELAEQLEVSDYRMTPQLRLEYGVLLYQNNRSAEGDSVFRSLRRLWQQSEQFVQVPERLRWLRDMDGDSLRTVQAITGSDYEHRAMARVREFGELQVPFRPEEFGFRELRPGMRFACHVTFGHNGPFLRPVTAGTKKAH